MTSVDDERVVDLTEVTETDRRPRERVWVAGGEVNRVGPARGEGSWGSTLWTRLAHLRARVAVVWARTRSARRVLISFFKSLLSPSRIMMEAHSLPMSSLVS